MMTDVYLVFVMTEENTDLLAVKRTEKIAVARAKREMATWATYTWEKDKNEPNMWNTAGATITVERWEVGDT